MSAFVVTMRRLHSADCGLVPPMGTCTCAARILYREAFAGLLEDQEAAAARITECYTGSNAPNSHVNLWIFSLLLELARAGGGSADLADEGVLHVELHDELWRDAPAPCGPWDSIKEQCRAWNAEHGIGASTTAEKP